MLLYRRTMKLHLKYIPYILKKGSVQYHKAKKIYCTRKVDKSQIKIIKTLGSILLPMVMSYGPTLLTREMPQPHLYTLICLPWLHYMNSFRHHHYNLTQTCPTECKKSYTFHHLRCNHHHTVDMFFMFLENIFPDNRLFHWDL